MTTVDVPKRYRKIAERAGSGHSREAAIHIQCLQCCGWERRAVRECKSEDCPLYLYRPYRKVVKAPFIFSQGAKNRDLARAKSPISKNPVHITAEESAA